MKKYFVCAMMIAMMFGGLRALPVNASIEAIEGNLRAAAEEGAGYGEPQDPRVTAAVIIRTALQLVGMIFLVLLVYAGALWMMAGGNEERVETAKKIIKAAVIGLAIVVCAYSITLFVSFVIVQRGDTSAIETNPPQSQYKPFNP